MHQQIAYYLRVLKITGHIQKSLAQEIEQIVYWFFNTTGLNLNAMRLKVEVSLSNQDNKGECYSPRRDKHDIWLNKACGLSELRETLLHELWHVHQIWHNKLVVRQGRKLFCNQDVTDILYLNQPHEIEARDMARKLFVCYMQLDKFLI